MNISLILVGAGIVICVILSGLFSASEMAITSFNRVRLENDAKDGSKGAARALKLDEMYDDTLSTILLSNNLVNIAASSLSTVFIIMLTGSDKLNWLITIVVTVLIIIFGETVPKIISKRYANSMASGISGFILMLLYILYPVNFLVVKITNLVTKSIGKNTSGEEDSDEVVEELQSIIETAEDEGVIDSEKSELVAAAIDFSDISAQDVMTARVDIQALDIDDPIGKIRKQAIASKKSRLPVYEGSIDNIIGIIHLNHLLKAFARESNPDIRSLLLEPCYVYKTARLPHVLDVLKEARQHMVIVTDEYSGTLGIVTMEDVLEEIVGDIWDEQDEIEEDIIESDNGELIFDGDVLIDDFLKKLDISQDNFDYESQTAGGWTIEYTGDFPSAGDKFEFRDYVVEILEADARRVGKIKVTPQTPQE